MGAQRSRPQTAVRSANHPGRSSAVAVREPGLVDGITRLQQTAGNRATAARLVAIQRDAAKQPGPVSSVIPDYDRVYKGYWSLSAPAHYAVCATRTAPRTGGARATAHPAAACVRASPQ